MNLRMVAFLLLVPSLSFGAVVTPEDLENYFQLYVLKGERRVSQEKVTLQSGGEVAVLSHWRSLQSRDPAEEVCNGYRWLFFGRGVYAKGASEAFTRFPTLKKIYLEFFDISFGTKIGTKKAEILPTSRSVTYLKLGVERSSLAAKKPDWVKVKSDLRGGNCSTLGAQLVDDKYIDEKFLRQGKLNSP